MAKNLGITLTEAHEMTPAMIIDAATYAINTAPGADTERASKREATQDDYDNF